MQAATSETKSKSLDLSICVHHYTLRAPCPKGQGILPVFLGWMSVHRRKRLDERKSMAPSLAAQVDRKCASQRFVGTICVCDPAQADSVTECGSTWPILAFVSHPRLITTAQRGSWGAALLRRVAAHCGVSAASVAPSHLLLVGRAAAADAAGGRPPAPCRRGRRDGRVASACLIPTPTPPSPSHPSDRRRGAKLAPPTPQRARRRIVRKVDTLDEGSFGSAFRRGSCSQTGRTPIPYVFRCMALGHGTLTIATHLWA